MKIIDVPQTGKLGLQVAFQSRYGLVRRMNAIPKQPNTYLQLAVRGRLTLAASGFDLLTEDQQDHWNSVAAKYQTRATLGQSGPLTGLQLFVRINTNLAMFGNEPVLVPPPFPVFTPLAPQNLTIANTGGVVALRLTCPTSPGENTILSACTAQRSGVRRVPALTIMGTCPNAVQGTATITSLYGATFPLPVENERIFVSAYQMLNGWKGPASVFTALCPASSE